MHSINPSKSHVGFGWQTCLILLGKKHALKKSFYKPWTAAGFLLALTKNRGCCHFMSLHVTLCHFIIPATVTLFICSYLDIFSYGTFFVSFRFKQAKSREMDHQCLLSILLATLTSTIVPKPLNPDTVSYRMTLLQNRWKYATGSGKGIL